MISTQWQPRSTMAPPPAWFASQNHALCGPGCVSRERAHVTAPTCPASTIATAFRVFGVPRERFRAEDRLAVARGDGDGLLVQLVREADHDRVGLGMGDRLLDV